MQIRTATIADAAAIARVHVDSWRTTYKGILPDDYLANLTYAQREPLWREILSKPAGHSLDYVAEDTSGNIVGFASGGGSAAVTRCILGNCMPSTCSKAGNVRALEGD